MYIEHVLVVIQWHYFIWQLASIFTLNFVLAGRRQCRRAIPVSSKLVSTHFNSVCGNSYYVFDCHFQNRYPNCCLRLADTRYTFQTYCWKSKCSITWLSIEGPVVSEISKAHLSVIFRDIPLISFELLWIRYWIYVFHTRMENCEYFNHRQFLSFLP
jgi:hypothetical protein